MLNRDASTEASMQLARPAAVLRRREGRLAGSGAGGERVERMF